MEANTQLRKSKSALRRNSKPTLPFHSLKNPGWSGIFFSGYRMDLVLLSVQFKTRACPLALQLLAQRGSKGNNHQFWSPYFQSSNRGADEKITDTGLNPCPSNHRLPRECKRRLREFLKMNLNLPPLSLQTFMFCLQTRSCCFVLITRRRFCLWLHREVQFRNALWKFIQTGLQ